MSDWLRLVRAHNLLMAAGGVLAGGWIALERIAWPAELQWASLSGIGLGIAGNVLNDILDIRADTANRRADRPIAAGRIGGRAAAACVLIAAPGGLAAAALAGWDVLLVGVAALAVMALYSPLLKRVPLVGNLTAAAVAGLPLMYGAVAVGLPAAGAVPWMLAAALHLVREIVKDLSDLEGDLLAGRHTLAVVLGRQGAAVTAGVAALAFIPLSLLLPARTGYGGAYFLLALPAQMAVLLSGVRLLLGSVREARVSAVLKGSMIVGVVALVAGRLG